MQWGCSCTRSTAHGFSLTGRVGSLAWAARSLNLAPPLSSILSYHGKSPLPQLSLAIYSFPKQIEQAAQHSQGIQTLLEAEKDAAKVVQEARQCA